MAGMLASAPLAVKKAAVCILFQPGEPVSPQGNCRAQAALLHFYLTPGGALMAAEWLARKTGDANDGRDQTGGG